MCWLQVASSRSFYGPALPSCSINLTYKLLGSLLWVVLFSEKSWSSAKAIYVSKPRHNSRTKLCIELSLVHNRDNIEFYLYCKFQSLIFSVRRRNRVTDRLNDRQRDYSMPRGSAHRGIMKHQWCSQAWPGPITFCIWSGDTSTHQSSRWNVAVTIKQWLLVT